MRRTSKTTGKMTAVMAAIILTMGMTGCGSKAEKADKKDAEPKSSAAETVSENSGSEKEKESAETEAETSSAEESTDDTESKSGGLFGKIKEKAKQGDTSSAAGTTTQAPNKKPSLKPRQSETAAQTTAPKTTTSAEQAPAPSAGSDRAVQPELALTIDGNYIPLPCDVADLYGFTFENPEYYSTDEPDNTSAYWYIGEGDNKFYIGSAVIQGNYDQNRSGRLLEVNVNFDSEYYTAEYMGLNTYATPADIIARFGEPDWNNDTCYDYDVPSDIGKSTVSFFIDDDDGTLKHVRITYLMPKMNGFPDFEF